MSYEGAAEPIKIGYLMDFLLPADYWMGTGYLVARQLEADGVNSRLVDRFGEE